MGRKIFRSGNSAVVSLPTEILEVLDLELGDEVSVTADLENRRIVLTPTEEPLSDITPELLEAVDRFIERYHPALEKLADE